MIQHLRIQNFALLEEIQLDFGAGLSLFTGETGAGKSILVDALCRLLGSRATADDIRAGAQKAILECIFDAAPLPKAATNLLNEWQIDVSGEALIIRREILATGKSRSLINNCTVTLQQLRLLSPYLADIFGQNEHQTLLDADSQQSLFDRAAGVQKEVAQLARIATDIHQCRHEWLALREREQQRQRQIDILRYQIAEIEEARISPEEEQQLREQKRLLQNSERINALCESLLHLVLEKDENLSGQIQAVARSVAELEKFKGELSAHSTRLLEWQEQLSELVSQIDSLRSNVEFEQTALDDLESRLEQLDRLKKKYGPTLTEVVSSLEAFRSELAELLNSGEREEELVRQITSLGARYDELASGISEARRERQKLFEVAVGRELKQVSMGKCRFQIVWIDKAPEDATQQSALERSYSPCGYERVEFQIEPNPGEGFRPLSRIASGGELSRLMLALKVVARSQREMRALIFDEVDAGIGGRAAYQVGERLKALSMDSQVLCVTHLPQVAAFADAHFQVSKSINGGRTITVVRQLEEDLRIAELARMLSGSEITETALQHARELRGQVYRGAV